MPRARARSLSPKLPVRHKRHIVPALAGINQQRATTSLPTMWIARWRGVLRTLRLVRRPALNEPGPTLQSNPERAMSIECAPSTRQARPALRLVLSRYPFPEARVFHWSQQNAHPDCRVRICLWLKRSSSLPLLVVAAVQCRPIIVRVGLTILTVLTGLAVLTIRIRRGTRAPQRWLLLILPIA